MPFTGLLAQVRDFDVDAFDTAEVPFEVIADQLVLPEDDKPRVHRMATELISVQVDMDRARALLAESVRLHALLALRWPELSRRYRAALPEVTSMAAWEATFREHSEIGA